MGQKIFDSIFLVSVLLFQVVTFGQFTHAEEISSNEFHLEVTDKELTIPQGGKVVTNVKATALKPLSKHINLEFSSQLGSGFKIKFSGDGNGFGFIWGIEPTVGKPTNTQLSISVPPTTTPGTYKATVYAKMNAVSNYQQQTVPMIVHVTAVPEYAYLQEPSDFHIDVAYPKIALEAGEITYNPLYISDTRTDTKVRLEATINPSGKGVSVETSHKQIFANTTNQKSTGVDISASSSAEPGTYMVWVFGTSEAPAATLTKEVSFEVVILGLIIDEMSEKENSSIPSWFQNNAQWWYDGLTSDEEMVNAIENLIGRGVIQIDSTQIDLDSELTDAEVSIPTYVKDVFGFWGDGLVPDTDIINSIQFLIGANIISSPEIREQIKIGQKVEQTQNVDPIVLKQIFETQMWNVAAFEYLLEIKNFEVEKLGKDADDTWNKFADNDDIDTMNLAHKLQKAESSAKGEVKIALDSYKKALELANKAKQDAKNSGIPVLELEEVVSTQQEIIDKNKKVNSVQQSKDLLDYAKKLQKNANQGLQKVVTKTLVSKITNSKEINDSLKEEIRNQLDIMPQFFYYNRFIDEIKDNPIDNYGMPLGGAIIKNKTFFYHSTSDDEGIKTDFPEILDGLLDPTIIKGHSLYYQYTENKFNNFLPEPEEDTDEENLPGMEGYEESEEEISSSSDELTSPPEESSGDYTIKAINILGYQAPIVQFFIQPGDDYCAESYMPYFGNFLDSNGNFVMVNSEEYEGATYACQVIFTANHPVIEIQMTQAQVDKFISETTGMGILIDPRDNTFQ